MDEPLRWRGDEGYGACFDDARGSLQTICQKGRRPF